MHSKKQGKKKRKRNTGSPGLPSPSPPPPLLTSPVACGCHAYSRGRGVERDWGDGKERNNSTTVCSFLHYRRQEMDACKQARALGRRHNAKAIIWCAIGKRLTNRLPKLSLTYNTLPTWNGGMFRSRRDKRVDVLPTRGSHFWGPRDSIFQV